MNEGEARTTHNVLDEPPHPFENCTLDDGAAVRLVCADRPPAGTRAGPLGVSTPLAPCLLFRNPVPWLDSRFLVARPCDNQDTKTPALGQPCPLMDAPNHRVGPVRRGVGWFLAGIDRKPCFESRTARALRATPRHAGRQCLDRLPAHHAVLCLGRIDRGSCRISHMASFLGA